VLLLMPLVASAQGFAGLGTEARDYAPVTAPAGLQFPRDHAAHPAFRIEWWYLTANLTGPGGESYGVQWTLFRQATRPQPEQEDAGWASPQIWMGHAALTTSQKHYVAETFARGGIGQAGVALSPFKAWIDNWEMAAAGDDLRDLRVMARGDTFAFDLRASTTARPVPQGAEGFSVKAAGGEASYYYSQPFYSVEGVLEVEGQEVPVSGQAWLDREWSSQPLGEDQEGWDWFSLHLENGAKLMAFRLRGACDPYVSGTWIAADGTPTPLGSDEIILTPLEEAEVAGRQVPVAWRLEVPAYDLAVDTRPLNAQSWMDTAFPYWEGPITVSGSQSGRGYLEMTGY
jgi:predicted secreted hydrolase